MRRAFRVVLICWMALVIPVQGMAAASMLLCAPGHAPVQASDAPHDHHHAHGSGGVLEPTPAADGQGALPVAVADPDDDSTGPAPADADASSAHHPAGHKCSACAACCSGQALPSLGVVITVMGSTAQLTPVQPIWMTDVVAAGLERPPRTIPRS